MDHPRDHFLAYAAFAADEDGYVHWRDLHDLLADAHHLRAGGKEAEVFSDLVAVIAERLILRVELLFLAAFEHGRVELGLFKWLGEIVERADADGFDNGADFVRAGKHDDVQIAVDLDELLERIDAVLLGHENVKNDEVGPVPGADFFNSVLAGRKSLHLEAVHFEEGLQVFANARFVIHDENTFFLRHPCSPFRLRSAQLGSIGIRNLKVLPRCGSLSTQILPRWACTRRLAMARPRPIPDVLGSTRTKSSKIS